MRIFDALTKPIKLTSSPLPRQPLIRFSLCVAVGAFLSTGFRASQAAELSGEPPGVFFSDVSTGSAGSVLAQSSWPSERYGRQSSDREVRLRAKSVIRLGLFVAALVGGIITYIIRLASGTKEGERSDPRFRDPRFRDQPGPAAGGSSPAPASRAGAAGAMATLPPVRNKPAGQIHQPPKPMPVAAVAPSSGGVVLAVVLGGFAFFLAATGCVVLLFFAFTATTPTPPDIQPFPAEQVESMFAQLGTMRESADSDFEQRWEAAAAAGVFDDDESSSPITGASEEANGFVRPRFPELVPPAATIPLIPWDESDLVASGISITGRGMSFDDTSPSGGVLVGFQVTRSRARFESIQPIYQLADQYVLGELQGKESSEEVAQLLANPGDAVAAVRLDLGGRIEGIQVEFGRIVNHQVDLASRYNSRLFGREVAGNAVVIEGEGDLFVGVSGKIRDGMDGLSLKRNMALGDCEVDQPAIASTGTKTLPRAGSKAGNEFKESAPEGGFLVGMRIFIGRSWGGAIQGVQPIYQIGSEYQAGMRYGADGGLAHQVLARPGYAVGKIDARAGLVLNSVKLTFQHITDGRLDSQDAYESDRFGSPGGSAYELDSAGQFMVGLGGSFQDDMVSLEAVVAEE